LISLAQWFEQSKTAIGSLLTIRFAITQSQFDITPIEVTVDHERRRHENSAVNISSLLPTIWQKLLKKCEKLLPLEQQSMNSYDIKTNKQKEVTVIKSETNK